MFFKDVSVSSHLQASLCHLAWWGHALLSGLDPGEAAGQSGGPVPVALAAALRARL